MLAGMQNSPRLGPARNLDRQPLATCRSAPRSTSFTAEYDLSRRVELLEALCMPSEATVASDLTEVTLVGLDGLDGRY